MQQKEKCYELTGSEGGGRSGGQRGFLRREAIWNPQVLLRAGAAVAREAAGRGANGRAAPLIQRRSKRAVKGVGEAIP
jgi:hypothetical protein